MLSPNQKLQLRLYHLGDSVIQDNWVYEVTNLETGKTSELARCPYDGGRASDTQYKLTRWVNDDSFIVQVKRSNSSEVHELKVKILNPKIPCDTK